MTIAFSVCMDCNLTIAEMEAIQLDWIEGNFMFTDSCGISRGPTHLLALGPNVPDIAIFDSNPSCECVDPACSGQGTLDFYYTLHYKYKNEGPFTISDSGYVQNGDTVTVTIDVDEPECVPGEEKCVGDGLMRCYEDGWHWVDQCSPDCGCVEGCTDPNADNYDPTATQDDGSCMYGGACAEGATTCQGADLYRCVNGSWELYEYNSSICTGGGENGDENGDEESSMGAMFESMIPMLMMVMMMGMIMGVMTKQKGSKRRPVAYYPYAGYEPPYTPGEYR